MYHIGYSDFLLCGIMEPGQEVIKVNHGVRALILAQIQGKLLKIETDTEYKRFSNFS